MLEMSKHMKYHLPTHFNIHREQINIFFLIYDFYNNEYFYLRDLSKRFDETKTISHFFLYLFIDIFNEICLSNTK